MVFPIVGGTQDTGYEIDNSVRFNRGDGADLSRAPSANGNRKTFTFSTWFKLGIPPYDGSSADYDIFSANSTNNFNDNFRLRSDGQIQIQAIVSGSSNNGYNFRSNMLFRDPSAWYHLVVGIDTTQSTNSDGVKVYVNGSLITGTYHAYNQNISTSFNKDGSTMSLGHTENDGGNHYDGYISETNFIDGTQLDASYFGETNDNGVWIPKKYTGSYGTNGFFLEYQQTGTSQNSSGIGADTSGNDNHFAVTNLAATDITVDTPTNNFATVNPLIRPYSGESLSEGNLKATATHASVSGSFWGTIPLTNGKWYWECKITTLQNAHWIGVSDDLEKAGLGTTASAARSYGIFYKNNGKKSIDETESNYGNTYAQGDIIGVALDMDNKNIYFSKNGTFQNSGDPTTGSTGTGKANSSALEDIVLPACMQDNGDATVTEWNFGNPPFAISSGNSDANGYGNFEYAVPSGYYALCTKNLAEYG